MYKSQSSCLIEGQPIGVISERHVVSLNDVVPLGDDELRVAVDLSQIEHEAKVEGVFLVIASHVLIRRQVLHRYHRVIDGQQQHCRQQEQAIDDEKYQVGLFPDGHDPVDKVRLGTVVLHRQLVEDAKHYINALG
eukprot:CAMPEP_0204592200 /NCGR_PEP_ID=MMETSP0661-20131031/50799_1 /ASSEMBLY_ACC=CAM_ASM_000606 /TAXON_ID=109239 /ORGANISM="Alexandrium margalefi, Strain AMGDE01CS-322" /LENGTH=134 /DNA_ID=CAMNT_0051602391 /DNA_START=129 /DNA_END=533 /DNA_ORIENTATION=+